MTLEDVAEKVGVSRATVLRWESGEIESVRSDKIAQLAQALSMSPAQLMGWDNEPASTPTYTILSRGARQLREDQQKQLLDVARALFKEAFTDGERGQSAPVTGPGRAGWPTARCWRWAGGSCR